MGRGEGPLANEGDGKVEDEIDGDVGEVTGTADAQPGEGPRKSIGELPGEEREMDDRQEGQDKKGAHEATLLG